MSEAPISTINVNGARIEVIERGHGLFLHPHIGLDPIAPVLAMLAEGGRLIAPSHPVSVTPTGWPGSRQSMISPTFVST